MFHEIGKPNSGDILALPVEADAAGGLTGGKPQPVIASPEYAELSPALSADGRWLAYSSTEGGGGIFVRPFRGAGGPWQVSPNGSFPVWSPAKNELAFVGPGRRVMIARYSATSTSFRIEQTDPWPGAELAAGQFKRLAVAPDGDHLVAGLVDPNADQSVNVVLHMLSALTR